jgi:hypothetical protein
MQKSLIERWICGSVLEIIGGNPGTSIENANFLTSMILRSTIPSKFPPFLQLLKKPLDSPYKLKLNIVGELRGL